MVEVRVSTDIAAAPGRVASLVAAFDLAADFHPQIASCTVVGEGVGATRALFLADGQRVHERLVAETSRGYTYVGVEASRSFASWRGRIEVEPRGEGARVLWTIELEPGEGVDVEEIVAQQRGILEEGLASVKRQLEGLD